jgi:hypothetical protein
MISCSEVKYLISERKVSRKIFEPAKGIKLGMTLNNRGLGDLLRSQILLSQGGCDGLDM